MQNAPFAAAITRASEAYHISHEALLSWKLPIVLVKSQN